MKRLLIIVTLFAILLTACGRSTAATSAPTETVAPASTSTLAPTSTPAPTLTVAELDALVASIKPTPTGDGSPHPISWAVSPYSTFDGRAAFMADDPAVLRTIKQNYEQGLIYFSFLNGLPDRPTFEKEIDTYLAGDTMRQRVLALFAEYRQGGAYWRKSVPAIFDWQDETAEFNADGSEITIGLRLDAGAITGEKVSLSTGKITQTQVSPELLYTVTMRYDTQSGRWRVVDEHYAPIQQP